MSMIRVLATTVAGVFTLSFALSCASPAEPKFALKAAERRGRLESNGLRFVVMPDESTQLAEVVVRYDVGASEDPPGRAGLAHLVEHMMFQTRPDGPNTPPIFQTILDIATDMNANTNWDRTHYYMASSAENLDSMLKIEAMRMYYGCQNVPESEFEREREVVRNEIRAQSSAEGQVYQYVEAAFYPKGHAYERMVGGNDEQIASCSLQDVCDFMKKYYTPDRAVLIVAGGVKVDDTITDIQKWFAKIPKRAAAPRTDVKPFVVEHEKKEIEADVERPSVWIGWPLPASNTPEGEMAQFGVQRLIGEISDKADEYNFAYDVQPQILGGELAPLFVIQIELKGMNKLDDALEFAQKAAKSAYRGFDDAGYDDNEAFRKLQQARFVQSLERLDARTEFIASQVQFSKDIDFDSTDMYTFHELDKIAKFDISKVSSVVKNALAWDKAGIIVVKPGTKGLTGDKRSTVKFSANGDAAFTDPPVDPAQAKHPIRNVGTLKNLSGADHIKLKNGMEVVLLPVHAMPLATASLIFKNAGDASTPNNPLLASSAAEFLSQPPDAEVYSRTGVHIGCSTSDDAMTCRTRGINIYLDVMLKGLERQIKAGTYSQERIEDWQKQIKEQFKLKSAQEETEYIRQVVTALYGPDHAYTKTAVATPEAAGKIHKDVLDDFRSNHYTAGNATLVVAGDFDVKYAEKLVHSTFDDWSTGTTDKPVDKNAAKRSGPIFTGVTKNKVDQQVTVTLAYPAPAGIDGQEAARQVLAGMLNIRSEDMRFKLGSTYGLYFSRQPKIGPTAYMLRGGAVMGGTIDAERAGETLKALRASLDALRAGDHFDEDFVRSRRKLLSSMLGESTVTSELAARLGQIALYGLDANFNNTLLQQIAAVSPAQVRALIQHELDPQNEIIVVLGDKDHVNKTFADAGIKDVKIVEPDYK